MDLNYANDQHHQAGFGANLVPVDCLDNEALRGEWQPSKVVIPRTAPSGTIAVGDVEEREIIAVGASYSGTGASGFNNVSLIEGYAASRGLPNVLDPNTPDDASDIAGGTPENWLSAIFNEGTNQDPEIIQDMITENNIAPYPFENDGVNFDTMYPGGANQLPGLELHDESVISSTTVSSTLHLKGGNFPCGLIGVRFNNFGMGPGINQEVNWDIFVDLVPGTHRGYLCEPMTEM